MLNASSFPGGHRPGARMGQQDQLDGSSGWGRLMVMYDRLLVGLGEDIETGERPGQAALPYLCRQYV